MAIPKITREEEQVLLTTGLLDFPLSPLTLQETALLDGPSSPSDVLIPACEKLTLAPFMGSGSVSPRPIRPPSVPAAPSDELGSDNPLTRDVPDTVAPKSLTQIDSHWEAMPHVREVSAPTTIEFKTHEIEELDPETGKIIRTRVIYPIIKEKENVISIPPLSDVKGELNSLAPSPLAVKSKDSSTLMTTTPQGPPAPRSSPPAPAATPTRDIADSEDVRTSPPWTPMPPRWIPLTPTSSPVRDFRSSRVETPVGPQADLSVCARPLSVPPRPSPSRPTPCDSLLGEECEGEEGQFDDAEESEPGTPLRLHPCEQPLPPSPSPSPTPSPMPSQMDRLVQHILELKCAVAASPAAVGDTVADPPEALLCPGGRGPTTETLLNSSNQGEKSTASNTRISTTRPPILGRGAMVKQLFAPHGAFAAPAMVCPPPVARESAKELTALEPSTLPPLLPRSYIQPMTMESGHLSPPSLAVDSQDTKLQAVLDQVTPAPAQLTVFADQAQPMELSLPKLYSLPLSRTSPTTPVLDEAPVGSPPSPMDSENDLPLNSIPVAEILPKGVSLTSVIFSRCGPRRPGTAVKLLVRTPKHTRRRYGRSRNQCRCATHAKA